MNMILPMNKSSRRSKSLEKLGNRPEKALKFTSPMWIFFILNQK